MQQQLLVIDDSKPIHTLVRSLLADEPVEIHSAPDAKLGITLAASLRPDLILLDVDMPETDGFEACRLLKADPITASIPIVFLTSLSSTEEKVHGLNMGAVDYVTKPFKLSEFLARVRASLRTSHLIRLLEEKAMIDALTGLGNRAMFEQRLAAEVSLRVRSINPLALILLDVDNFKNINDGYGHPYGDHVLRKIATSLTDLCRTEDVACRHGGEEFVILTPHTNAADAALLAERMRQAISEIPFTRNNDVIQVTASFGVADALHTYDRSMLERADEALYRSKQQGKNRVTVAPSQVEAIAA